MSCTPRIVTSNRQLKEQYHLLEAGDIVDGRVSMRPGEEGVLLDLVERGVALFPSALSQLISRSKAMQAKIFGKWMPPHTYAVHDLHQLMALLSSFPAGAVITKLDQKNAGQGIHYWASLEDVYTQASLGTLPLPIVVQPFFADALDIRVIIIGDFCEAYQRHNPNNFRNNLHCGAQSNPCDLTEKQRAICQQAMERGKFPYAHVDLMLTNAADTYLIEINLRGGIRGASISAEEYQGLIAARHAQEVDKLDSSK